MLDRGVFKPLLMQLVYICISIKKIKKSSDMEKFNTKISLINKKFYCFANSKVEI